MREGILIFGHTEDDLPELWDFQGCVVAVGASDVEASTLEERAELAKSRY